MHDYKRYERVCLVGNGASANDRGEEIDSWPTVVRMNAWRTIGPVNAGNKCDVLAWHGTRLHAEIQDRYELQCGDPAEHWFLLPLSHYEWHSATVFRAAGTWMYVIPQSQHDSEKQCLRAMTGREDAVPSTGFTCVNTAIKMGAKELLLVGYDCTWPDLPGWHDACHKWRCPGHPMAAEKLLIKRLADHGIWCGEPVDVKVTWHRSAEVDAVMESALRRPLDGDWGTLPVAARATSVVMPAVSGISPKLSRGDAYAYWREPCDANAPYRYVRQTARTEALRVYAAQHMAETDSILDIGCNVGRDLNGLYRAGYTDLTGIDINGDALRLVHKYFSELAGMATLHEGAVEEILPIVGEFDWIYTMSTLEHMHSKSAGCFEQMAKAVRKGLITIECETHNTLRSWPRRYDEIFVPLGLRQIQAHKCVKGKTLDGHMVRVFVKE